MIKSREDGSVGKVLAVLPHESSWLWPHVPVNTRPVRQIDLWGLPISSSSLSGKPSVREPASKLRWTEMEESCCQSLASWNCDVEAAPSNLGSPCLLSPRIATCFPGAKVNNISALRTFRVFRALKAISVVSGEPLSRLTWS